MSQQSQQELNDMLEYNKNTICRLNSYIIKLRCEQLQDPNIDQSNKHMVDMLINFTEHKIHECKNISKLIRDKLKILKKNKI